MLRGAQAHDEQSRSAFKMIPSEIDGMVPHLELDDGLLTKKLTDEDRERYEDGDEVDASTNTMEHDYYKPDVEGAMEFLLNAPDDAQRKLVMEMRTEKATEKMRVRTDSYILFWYI